MKGKCGKLQANYMFCENLEGCIFPFVKVKVISFTGKKIQATGFL